MADFNVHEASSTYGIPVEIPIDDDIRHADCNAQSATLVSVEGEHALYKGTCTNGHRYDIRMQVKSLEEQVESIEEIQMKDGKLTLGGEGEHPAEPLEDF